MYDGSSLKYTGYINGMVHKKYMGFLGNLLMHSQPPHLVVLVSIHVNEENSIQESIRITMQ